MELCCQTRGTNFAGNFFAPNPEDAKGMFMKRNKERNKDLVQFSNHGGWGSLNNGSLKFFMDKTTVHVTHMRSSTASINSESPTACVSPRMGLVQTCQTSLDIIGPWQFDENVQELYKRQVIEFPIFIVASRHMDLL